MRIGIISDTHRLWSRIEQALKLMGEVDIVLHLGDNTSDAEDIRNALKNVPVVAVKGNCDQTESMPEERVLLLDGKKIFMTHGHKYNVKYDYDDIYIRAKEIGADAALFGHSHYPIILKKGGTVLVNPGSASLPKQGSSPSFALMTTDNGSLQTRLVTMNKFMRPVN